MTENFQQNSCNSRVFSMIFTGRGTMPFVNGMHAFVENTINKLQVLNRTLDDVYVNQEFFNIHVNQEFSQ